MSEEKTTKKSDEAYLGASHVKNYYDSISLVSHNYALLNNLRLRMKEEAESNSGDEDAYHNAIMDAKDAVRHYVFLTYRFYKGIRGVMKGINAKEEKKMIELQKQISKDCRLEGEGQERILTFLEYHDIMIATTFLSKLMDESTNILESLQSRNE